jgi:branched-chain amino acid transport system ATP-binding protein
MSEKPLLQVDNIHTFIGQFHILEGVSTSVPRGSIHVLLGRNGAGKTTTLKSIMGITPPSKGAIYFNGVNLVGKRPYQIAQMGIGYVPEHRAIFKDLSVRENLLLAGRKNSDFERKEDYIFQLFPDLKRLIHLGGGQLSGGQQQMLAVARALVPDNQLLLIDEPSEGLAPVIIESLMAAIASLSSKVTVLLVEQNFRVASKLGQHFTILDEGQSVQAGMMESLVSDAALIQKYLGVA